MLLSPEAVGSALDAVTAQDFYKPSHGLVFGAIADLYSRGERADAVTVAHELRRREALAEAGGPAILVSLQANTPSVTSAGRYATIVAEASRLRRLAAAGQEIQALALASDAEPQAAASVAEALIYDAALARSASEPAEVRDAVAETVAWLEERYGAPDTLTGTPTGFYDLDDHLGGLQPDHLIVIGARPSMGKTSLALAVALAAARSGAPVLFFSLEMSRRELVLRLLSATGRIDSKRLGTARLVDADWPKLSGAIEEISGLPITIHDDPNVTIADVRTRARRKKARGGLGLIVVDYLQLMSGRANAETRQVELAEISRGLKLLARELHVPVLALSQLSRSLEARSDKRPMLSDLRETGALEQDADVVLFIYRDEVYHPDSADLGTAEVIVSKNRNGPIGAERLAWLGQFSLFANMARDLAPPSGGPAGRRPLTHHPEGGSQTRQ